MNLPFRLAVAAVAVVVAVPVAPRAVFAAQNPAVQNPAAPPSEPAGASPEHRSFPAPTNLQVLPKDLTGEQVHKIMEQWEGDLGSGCRTCHAVDPKKVGPNGRPRLNFADDSKEEKKTARLMYRMTDKINTDYVSMVPNSGQSVTCGTCHRGHLGPEPFVPAKHEEHGPVPAAPNATPNAAPAAALPTSGQ
jgi:hypothetical protein